MAKTYPTILLHESSNTQQWSVHIPDIPGCVSCGESIEHAKEMASDALDIYIKDYLDTGGTIPEPSCVVDAMRSVMDFVKEVKLEHICDDIVVAFTTTELV